MNGRNETIVWHKYPETVPAPRCGFDEYLVTVTSTVYNSTVTWTGTFWWNRDGFDKLTKDDVVLAWAEMPKGWIGE